MAKKPKTLGGPQKASDGALSRTDGTHAKKPPLTDAERHKRFVAMSKEVEASKNPVDFDKVFSAVVTAPKSS